MTDFPGALGVVFRADRVCLHKVLLQDNAGKIKTVSHLKSDPSGWVDIGLGCIVILLGQ